MEKIAIFGAGGFGREVLTLIKAINGVAPVYEFIGFFDDGLPKGGIVNGYPILGGMEDLIKWNEKIDIAVAIGNPNVKAQLIESISNEKISFPTLIHPSALICDSDSIKIGIGCIICAACILTTNINLDDFVILNLNCTVGHDTKLGKFSSFMPSVNISGEVSVGKRVYVGTGAKIINQLNIGENTIIGAGAVVSRSIPSNCTAVGIPAKIIKMR